MARASIKAYAEVLEDMFREVGDLRSAGMMQKMDKQIDRLADLIRSLLDVTRISQGRLDLRKERFDMDELISQMVEDIQLATKHQLIVEENTAGTIYADRERIGQVLCNLICNAIKYSAQGDHVLISARRNKEKNVRVCVQDFGIGMSEEVRAKAFDRFYRANDGIDNAYPGLGLGLYITAEIVRLHGGIIRLESKEGDGSTFCFSLPIQSE